MKPPKMTASNKMLYFSLQAPQPDPISKLDQTRSLKAKHSRCHIVDLVALSVLNCLGKTGLIPAMQTHRIVVNPTLRLSLVIVAVK